MTRVPNTGGMGAFSPSPLIDASLQARIMREIVIPVVDGMRAEGTEYRGFLYVGLMLTVDGPKVIEFNVRFGDPEAQVVMPLVASGLLSQLLAASEGRLSAEPIVCATRLRSVSCSPRGVIPVPFHPVTPSPVSTKRHGWKASPCCTPAPRCATANSSPPADVC